MYRTPLLSPRSSLPLALIGGLFVPLLLTGQTQHPLKPMMNIPTHQTPLFGSLFDQYQSAWRLHFNAVIKSTTKLPGFGEENGSSGDSSVKRQQGKYEFFLRGKKHKVISRLAKEAPLIKFAYDGNEFRYVSSDRPEMIVAQQNPDAGATPVNPVVSPFRFIKPLHPEAGQFEKLRISDFEEDASSLKERLKRYRVVNEDPLIADFPIDPSGTSAQARFRVHVKGDSVLRPSIIDRYDKDGRHLSRTEMAYFDVAVDGKTNYWPSRVTNTAYQPTTGKVVMKRTYSFETFDLAPDFPDDTFTIGPPEPPTRYAETTIASTGETAPRFSCSTLSGKEFSLDDHLGKVVLINLFKIRCGPCQAEIPHLESKVFQKYQNRSDFQLIAVARGNSVEELKSFKQRKEISYPVVPDANQQIYRQYASDYVPRNVIIGRDGTVKYHSVGFTKYRFRRLVNKIEQLLEKGSDSSGSD